jgi:hypothetical protein
MSAIVKNSYRYNNVAATGKASAIKRIHNIFKVELIQEYDDMYKVVHNQNISFEMFDQLMEESVATIQKKLSVLSIQAAIELEVK